MNAMLIEVGVSHCIHYDLEGHLDDFKAQSLIVQSCFEEHLIQISDQMSAFGMWQYLMSLFTSKSKGKLMSLHEEARMFKMSNGEKPSSYILRARKIATTIRSLGDEFTELS